MSVVSALWWVFVPSLPNRGLDTFGHWVLAELMVPPMWPSGWPGWLLAGGVVITGLIAASSSLFGRFRSRGNLGQGVGPSSADPGPGRGRHD